MASSFVAPRTQLIFALCLPLAVLIGFFLAQPLDAGSAIVLGLVLGSLSIPILMKWYHPLLVVSWNVAVQPYIPGRPALWTLLAFLGLGVAVLNRSVNSEAKFVQVPSIKTPLLVLLGVVVVTALLQGGSGVRSLGSHTYGGRSYFLILAAIAGFFTLTSQRIPKERARTYVGLFFLAGTTALIPNLTYLAGPSFSFLFYIFPPVLAAEQAAADYGPKAQIVRLHGLSILCWALSAWGLSRYGYKGLLSLKNRWGLVALALGLAASLFCGFRSMFIFVVLLLVAQFYFEGLMRGKALAITVGMGVLACALVLPITNRLPLVVQRTISFLPVPVSNVARETGRASSEWRLSMWSDVLPEVPSRLLLGGGYALDPDALHFTAENMRRGFVKPWDWAIVTNAYHNGPLSLLMPLGIWGLGAFTWLMVACIRYFCWALWHGDPELHAMNTTLLALFVAKLVLFASVYGNLPTDLCLFTGLVGLSVSLNGPVVSEGSIGGDLTLAEFEKEAFARRGLS